MAGSHHAVEEASVDKGAEYNGLGFLADEHNQGSSHPVPASLAPCQGLYPSKKGLENKFSQGCLSLDCLKIDEPWICSSYSLVVCGRQDFKTIMQMNEYLLWTSFGTTHYPWNYK